MFLNSFRSSAAFSIRVLMAVAFPGVFFASPTQAQQIGKVVEYGIYSEDNQLLEQTTRIPGGGPIRFGFCFEADIQFFDDERYMMVESLEHPAVSGQEGGESTGYSVPRLFKVRDGIARGCSGYRARDASDLRPGAWKFTISDGPDDVVVQEFTITR